MLGTHEAGAEMIAEAFWAGLRKRSECGASRFVARRAGRAREFCEPIIIIIIVVIIVVIVIFSIICIIIIISIVIVIIIITFIDCCRRPSVPRVCASCY